MAKIPVEKKGGTSWLWWVLGLALLVAAIWLLVEVAFVEDDEDFTEAVTPEAVEPQAGTAGAITSLAAILDAGDPSQLVGRDVQLSGVTASAVAGDSTYWVYNPDEGVEQRVFVVLYALGESETGPGTGADGRFNVDEGDNMTVEGVVQPVEPSDPANWGVTGEEAGEVTENQVYIRAHSLENVGP